MCEGTVVGQVACQKDGDDLWVGWALCPALCGRGNGAAFVSRCVTALRGCISSRASVHLSYGWMIYNTFVLMIYRNKLRMIYKAAP